jgi:hypothetical protein
MITRTLHAINECFVKENVPYSASNGTLIGAMRHGGIIPWDDDADIMLEKPSLDSWERVRARMYTDFGLLSSKDVGNNIGFSGFGYKIRSTSPGSLARAVGDSGVDVFGLIRDPCGVYKHPLFPKQVVACPSAVHQRPFGPSSSISVIDEWRTHLDTGYPGWETTVRKYHSHTDMACALAIPDGALPTQFRDLTAMTPMPGFSPVFPTTPSQVAVSQGIPASVREALEALVLDGIGLVAGQSSQLLTALDSLNPQDAMIVLAAEDLGPPESSDAFWVLSSIKQMRSSWACTQVWIVSQNSKLLHAYKDRRMGAKTFGISYVEIDDENTYLKALLATSPFSGLRKPGVWTAEASSNSYYEPHPTEVQV